VVGCASAVENDFFDAGGLGFGGEGGAEFLGAVDVGGKLFGAEVFVQAGEAGKRGAGLVVDGLGVDVLGGETHAEARAFGGAVNCFANSPAAFLEEIGFALSAHFEILDFGFSIFDWALPRQR